MKRQEIERERAAAYSRYGSNRVTTVGDEPIVVDFAPPGQKPGFHWVINLLNFLTECSTVPPSGLGSFPPLSGLFLCPPSTPTETLAQAVAGWNPAARPILIPLGLPGGDYAEINAGAPYPFVMCMDPGYELIVPYNYFLRGILVTAAGTAAPGPGVGSWGELHFTGMLEADDYCLQP